MMTVIPVAKSAKGGQDAAALLTKEIGMNAQIVARGKCVAPKSLKSKLAPTLPKVMVDLPFVFHKDPTEKDPS